MNKEQETRSKLLRVVELMDLTQMNFSEVALRAGGPVTPAVAKAAYLEGRSYGAEDAIIRALEGCAEGDYVLMMKRRAKRNISFVQREREEAESAPEVTRAEGVRTITAIADSLGFTVTAVGNVLILSRTRRDS